MNITILGAGNMGTALAKLLSENKHKVNLWSIEKDVVADINKNNKNSKYLKGIKLNKSITAYSNAKKSLRGAEIVVFSVPSHIIRIVAKEVEKLVPKKAIIVDVAKGLEKNSNKRMSEVLEEYFKNKIVAIGGPSIANEVARQIPTYVVFASKDKKTLDISAKVFKNNYYSVSKTTDIIGVELCGTLKNIIAIACGIVDGVGYGSNTKSGIITNGLKEISLIIETMKSKKETVHSLAGIGDLIVTCTSLHSRNRRFGENLGKGMSIKEAEQSVGQIVEGINAVKIVKKIIDKNKLNCPLIKNVYGVLFENEKAKSILQNKC